MPAYPCPSCQKPFTAPMGKSPARVRCPHCKQAVEPPRAEPPKWYYARAKKKVGPFTWAQFVDLARRGELQRDDMVLQEGSKQWVRADSVAGLFESKRSRGKLPWVIAGLAGGGACGLLCVCLVVAYFMLPRPPVHPEPVEPEKIVEIKKKDEIDPPKKEDPPKIEDKKPSEKIPPKVIPRAEWADQFIDRLNRQRTAAGLSKVAFDAELSRGCLAHAKYLAMNVEASKADATNVYEEDPQKPGYSDEGARAGKSAMIAYAAPLVAFDQWLGRVSSRGALLNPEVQSVGLGFEESAPGEWICVFDPVRGRGEPIVVYPAPKQIDVPVSFTSGQEIPDPKAVAGYPVTVTFPLKKQVTNVKIEMHDAKGNAIDGSIFTPDKPVRPGMQRPALAFIPKGLLTGSTVYQVKASAQVDGQPWSLDWSFITEDTSDGKGVWAKLALAKVNAYRSHGGLEPVVLDDALSVNCLKHGRYLVMNEGHPALQGLSAHDEDLKLPGASEEGRSSGLKSNIAIGDFEPTSGVDAWMATLYHRVPMLEPSLKRIGFACVRGRRQGWITLLDVRSGATKEDRPHEVLYPVPDQVGVPLNFPNGGEEPNPIPGNKKGPAGYPITAFFPHQKPLGKALGKLTDSAGKEVPIWFSSREQPANPQYAKHQGNTVCLIPKLPLTADSTYHVHLQGDLAGEAWEKKWKFTTGDAGPTVEAATRTALDRLNHYRAQAGLGAVILDDNLSFGCQRHAEYLGKNAEALLKKNASVNDEDVLLPGFTAEGLRSARQSLVFTNAAIPVMQIEDLMATFTARVYLLDPTLQRIGYGCYHDIGRGWRCVLDINGGRGEQRIVLHPAPKQDDVPTTGFDRAGYPISVTFPTRAQLGKVEAELKDQAGKSVDFQLATLPRNTVAVSPRQPLLAGHTYSVTVSAILNGNEWRHTWSFTTAKK